MSNLFSDSKRLNHIIRFFKDFFPNTHFEGVSRGLRLVTDNSDFSDDRPKSMLKVESEHFNYIINTNINCNLDKEDQYDGTATIEDPPNEVGERFLTLPLATSILESEGFIYESDFSEICTHLFHDLKYGNPFEEKGEVVPHLLPLVSAYHSNDISDFFTVAEKEEDKNTYIFDEEIMFDHFKATIIDEFNEIISKLKSHLGLHYPQEFFIQWQELSHHNSTECFLIINKYLDKKTAKRLAEYVDDKENYEKLMSLTAEKAFPVTRLALSFTEDTVIVSVPNRIISEGEIEIDNSQLVSSFLIARDGKLPKKYAINSIRGCITEMISAVLQIIIRDADIDGIEDLGDLLF